MFHTFHHTKRQLKNLPLAINMFGYNHLQEPVSRPHGVSLFQWFYCADGQGELILNGQKSVLSPGQGALVHAALPHAYHALTDQWHVHVIGFTGSYCMDLLKILKMHESGVYHFSDSEVFPKYLDKLMEIRQKQKKLADSDVRPNKRRDLCFGNDLSKLCYDFLLDLSSSIRFIRTDIPAGGSEIIKEIITYMEEHYAEAITLDNLSEHVQLSKGYMSTVFKAEMQQTVMQYLTKLRISQARILLIEYPEKKVLEIGRRCGFESPSYFGKTFKKIVGMTPEEFRIS